MYDRILVPVDGSAFSEEVLPHALGIAQASGAALSLDPVTGGDTEQAEAARYVGALATCRPTVGPWWRVATSPTPSLPRRAACPGHPGCDDLARHSGLMEALLGSVALRVVAPAALR